MRGPATTRTGPVERSCSAARTRPRNPQHSHKNWRDQWGPFTTKGSWLTPDSYRTGSGGQNLSVGTDPLTANTYTYVNGDPINLWDPSGHDADRQLGQSQTANMTPLEVTYFANQAQVRKVIAGYESEQAYYEQNGDDIYLDPMGSYYQDKIDKLRKLLGQQVLFFDAATSHSAVVFGDLQSAASISFFLEGTGSNIESAGSKAKAILAQACPNPASCSTASIAIDYGAPEFLTAMLPGGEDPAAAVASELVRVVNDAKSVAPSGATTTAIGHSYGSLVVAKALQQGLQVDNAIFTATSGLGVSSAAELGTTATLWIGKAPGDNEAQAAMCWLKAPLTLDPYCGDSRYGAEPSAPGFGAQLLDTGEARGHNQYYRQDSTSLRNIAAIVTGQL